MEHTLHPQPGYPFSLALERRVRAVGGRASGAPPRRPTSGAGRLPVRVRPHPYLTLGTRTGRPARAAAPGEQRRCASDERGIPTGSEPVDGTEFDFRGRAPIGSTELDNAFTDLERDDDGLRTRPAQAIPGRRR